MPRSLQKQRSAIVLAQEGQRVSMQWKWDTKVRDEDSTVMQGAAPPKPSAGKEKWMDSKGEDAQRCLSAPPRLTFAMCPSLHRMSFRFPK